MGHPQKKPVHRMTPDARSPIRSSAWNLYLILGGLGVVAYLLVSRLPLARGLLFTGATAYATIGVFAGIRLHRPRNAVPWGLFGAGLACWVAGSVAWNAYEFILDTEIPFPSLADPLFLAAYPLMAAGLLSVIRPARPERRAGWLDALIVIIGLGALSWVFFIEPNVHNPALTALQRMVSIAYPVGDLILFGLLVRLVMEHERKRASDWLLTIGVAALILGDVLWTSGLLGGALSAATPAYALWVAFLVAWGAAGLHPSMAFLGEMTTQREAILSRTRLFFLAAAALVPLAAIGLESVELGNTDGIVLPLMSAVMFLLVLIRARSLMVDVTKLRRLQDKLGASEEKYRGIVETTTEWIWEIDLRGSHTFSNPGIEKLLGYRPEELLHRDRLELVHPGDREEARATLSKNFIGDRTGWKGWTLRWLHKNGTERWLESNAVPIFDGSRNLVGFRGADRDITKRKHLEHELSRQALYDSLTELPNRLLFHDRLEHTLAGALRDGLSVALLMIDLDGFKAINDTFGHGTGDRLLVQAARRIQGCLRPADTAARLGGDEFAVLLGDASPSDALRVAERILQSLRDPIRVDDKELFVDASIGIAESPHGSVQAEAILRDADAAMYAAKNAGRRRIQVFRPELHQEVLERFELVTDLRRALERKEFSLRYQPIVVLEDERIKSLEALVRWDHPTRGLVPPLDFIPIAEQTGMVVHLDRWVMRQACEELRRWQDHFPSDPPLSVSVNVSARQLQDPELTREVERSLLETSLDPASLTLEITESVLMQDNEATAAILQDLRGLGVRLAIDDFGIGFSSLSYLRQLPVDVVKIDRSFVMGIASASEEWTLARGIIKLVHALGLETVAEGVERADQKAHLRALGCRFAQGYYFAKPMEADEVTRLLEERNARTA
jgi:diguanylate cyclase (GGDEF)-like protein/PAS domain S-box-containing protein